MTVIENAEHTFVTPVFNGSASLRNAAGQLIENTVKSVNRKQTIDDTYIEKLYGDMTSLYRLDQLSTQNGSLASGKADLGPLPMTAVVLLASLVCAWILIVCYVVWQGLKKKKNSQ